MKFLIGLLFLLSMSANAAIKISTYTCGTGLLTGTCTINITIPGTFGGTDPSAAGFQGRRLIKIAMWLEGRAAGDQVTALKIQDVNSVLPAPATGATVGNLIEQAVASGNRALTLPPGGLPFTIDFPTDPTNPSYPKAIVPSQLVIVATVLKSGGSGVDTFTINVAWDDFT